MNQSNSISQLLASHSADLDWQREFYEDLHRHPELSHHEERTASKIEAKLAVFDCELVTGIGGFGIAAIFRSPDEGPTVLMRADFDALPVVEQTGVDFASMNGNMHACGHDMHATALLGACAIINSLRGKWSGTFIALFQPAEETSDGAKRMLADGLISLIPRPDVCLAQHIMPGPAGQVQTAAGPIMAGCDSIRIRIAGRSAHASMPDKSIDPTLIAAMIVVRLQAIVGREVPPGEFFVISVGELHSGDKNNIIPDSAELVLNTRYSEPAVAERVYAALHRVVAADWAASASPAQPTFEYFAHGEVTDNDPATAIAVRATFDDVFSDNVIDAKPSTASEDFCYLPQAWGVPYYFWLVGSTPEELLDNPPVNHQSNFIPDFEPTCHSSTQAGAAAVLSFLAKA